MTIETGTRLGPYEIVSPIGAGGMGEVYKARDTKLDREVAIKVLPEEFAQDVERLARFDREAKLLASLNHPNIASIHGFEESGGVKALVLELVEGPTLAERIKQGPIAVDDAIAIAKQIAEALEAGHEAGIIHRDLKPANIKLKEDDTVKVLDYGLAKALEGESSSGADSELSQSPTLTRQGTQVGVILGTAAYMSPEQAKGKRVDRRTDIFAFGSLLFEMLTGQRAFVGEDVSETLAAVLRTEPEWQALPADLPGTLRTYLERCLEKDPRRRMRDIGDVRLALGGAFDNTVTESSRSRPVLPWAIAAVALLISVASIATRDLGGRQRVVPARFAVSVNGELPPRDGTLVALSPDGRDLVYAAITNDGDQLYYRSMDRLEVIAIQGTDEARAPFFSPGGEWVAFTARDGRLSRVPLSGGPATTICDCIPDVDGEWGVDGTIVYSDGATGALMKVSSNGGDPEPLTTLADGESSHDQPAFLPNGEAVLFTVWSNSLDDARLAAVLLSTGERRDLGDGFFPRFASTGHLLYGQAGAVWAVPFDPDRLEKIGTAIRVLQGVRIEGGGAVQFDLAGNGAAVYVTGKATDAERTVVWVDRAGREEALNVPRRAYQSVAISPDGSSIVLEVLGSGLEDLWLYDVRSQRASQFTFDGADDLWPVWAPDGERVFFVSQRRGPYGLYSKRADGAGQPELHVLLKGLPKPSSITPDGRILAYHASTPETGFDLLSVELEGEPRLRPLLASNAQETHPAISPDGRWLAYTSDELGQREVFVVPLSNRTGGKWRVSGDGGTEPVWSRDGRELFYRRESAMLAVSVNAGSTFEPSEPEFLFEGRYYRPENYGRSYDVAGDGQRFIMIRESEMGGAGNEIIVSQNWLEELEKLTATP